MYLSLVCRLGLCLQALVVFHVTIEYIFLLSVGKYDRVIRKIHNADIASVLSHSIQLSSLMK